MRLRVLYIITLLFSVVSATAANSVNYTMLRVDINNTNMWQDVKDGLIYEDKIAKISSDGVAKNSNYLKWTKNTELHIEGNNINIISFAIGYQKTTGTSVTLTGYPDGGKITVIEGSPDNSIIWNAPADNTIKELTLTANKTINLSDITIYYVPIEEEEEPQTIALTASLTKSEDFSEVATVSCLLNKPDTKLFWALEPLTADNVEEKGTEVSIAEDENTPGIYCASWIIPAIENVETANVYLMAMGDNNQYDPVTDTLEITYSHRHCTSIAGIMADVEDDISTVLNCLLTVTTVTEDGDIFLESDNNWGTHLLIRIAEGQQLPNIGDKAEMVCGKGFNLEGIIGIESSADIQWSETSEPIETPTEIVINNVVDLSSHYGHEVTLNEVRLYDTPQQTPRRLPSYTSTSYTVTEAKDPTHKLKVVSTKAEDHLASGITYSLRGVPVQVDGTPVFYQTDYSKVTTGLEARTAETSFTLNGNKLNHSTSVYIYDTAGHLCYRSASPGSTILPGGTYILITPACTRKILIP